MRIHEEEAILPMTRAEASSYMALQAKANGRPTLDQRLGGAVERVQRHQLAAATRADHGHQLVVEMINETRRFALAEAEQALALADRSMVSLPEAIDDARQALRFLAYADSITIETTP